ncbi:MAG: pectate lyase [Paludibacteraceae bacterium]|nr:pectate lyase [Paludibacteraceae bacterium]
MTTYTKIGYFLFGLLFCLAACNGNGPDPEPVTSVLAFPGAQGGGSLASGGRGGVVVHVTTLEDARDKTTGQPALGTLRKAVQMDGTRTIVFDVSGTINLTSQLDIPSGNVTIAGQTAPGDGICIAGYPVVVKASNVIIRFLRFRMGDQNKVEGDALSINDHKNIIIDHCSFSWCTDECVSVYGNTDFTLQYCFITESLRKSVHVKGDHGYGGIWGGTNASFHHNLLAHHDSRNPRFDHSYVNNKCFGPIDYVNNVVYNWGGNSTYGGEGYDQVRKINMVNNYYKYGPATKKKNRLVDPTVSCSLCSDGHTLIPGKFFLSGNYMFGSDAVTQNNWEGATVKTDDVKATARWTEGMTPLTDEQSAEQAFETVLTKAGCSLRRDGIDARIVSEVRNGSYTHKGSNGSTNGLIDSPSDVGGYPTLNSEPAPADTDHDGMPDVWEDANGLDKNSSEDGKLYTLDKEYTNLEVYLNSLVQNLF